MKPINIFFTSFKNPLDQKLFSNYLSLLPADLRKTNSRYIRWQNRHAHLFGRLLLLEALKIYGIEENIWDHVAYTSYHRPYLTLNGYDFNISHSGDFVICAVGKDIRLGVDIEKNKDINFEHFGNIMTPNQWDEINQASCPLKMFYKYWTIKESVVKADGRGFSIPLDGLEVKNNTVQVDENLWFVNALEFINGYSVALTTNQLSTFKMHEISFYE
ncbi:4'-phosphopantetheinyl transferase superfamily protein [bacterium]|nr:4'-phosphopantetheinyl transferase superfamily protein [bacterium]